MSANATLNNFGTLELDITSETSDAIENQGGTFNSSGIIEIGCIGTTNELEINNNLDFGTSNINFDISGTSTLIYAHIFFTKRLCGFKIIS